MNELELELNIKAIERYSAIARRCGVSMLKINGGSLEMMFSPTTSIETPQTVMPPDLSMPSDDQLLFAAVEEIPDLDSEAINPQASDAMVTTIGEEAP